MKYIWLLLCICILIGVSISGCLGGDDEAEKDESTLTLYKVDYSQNENYIYDIRVTEVYDAFNDKGHGEPWAIDDLCLKVVFDSPYIRNSTLNQRERNFGLLITSCKYSMDEYQSSLDFNFEYITEHNGTNSTNSTKPFLDLDYENLTLTAQYFDNDQDTRLSKDDSFQLTVTRRDDGGYYNLSNFRFMVKVYGGPLVVDLEIDYVPFSSPDEEGKVQGSVGGTEGLLGTKAIGIGVAISVVLVMLVLMMHMRKKGKDEDIEPESEFMIMNYK